MARRPPPLLQDVRRLFRGVSLVALEAANRSPILEAARAGDLEDLVSRTLKAALVSATDLAGLTRGRPRQMSAPHSTWDSVVYFSNDYEPEVTAFPGESADPSILEKPSPQSQINSQSRLVDVQEVPIAASTMTTPENHCRSQELEDSATMVPGVLGENGSMKVPILSSLPEMNLVGSAGADVPLKRRRLRERRVPSTPFSRALGFAGLGAGLAWGTIQESAKRIVFGMPKIEGKQSALSPFLSEKNAERLALALCRMRGAALKLGQMLSIQDESLVPAPILAALDIVRQGADVMPRKQLNDVLDAELGLDWSSKLRSFDYEPLAAASIGQYPGVADSIESDIENVRLILDYTNLIPKGLFLDNAIKVIACANSDRDSVIEMSRRLGFLTGEESDVMMEAHVQAGFVVGTPFAKGGGYDFGTSNITQSISNLGATMLKHRLTPPPEEAYSLHRKLSGAFLACIKLGAVVPCREILLQVYQQYQFGNSENSRAANCSTGL
ncbi:hypothetical protein BHM03_00000371 [Ensete ventricosum]|nr:hypothetical protein BHM03_00000371 [Ensete ventricosum]